MSEACEIVAQVTVDGIAYFGSSPAPASYVCASSAMYVPLAAPYVCAGAAGAHAAGRYLQSPAAQMAATKAASKGCEIFVSVGKSTADFVVVKGKATAREVRVKAHEAKRKYRALNTPEGISWLMRVLSGM